MPNHEEISDNFAELIIETYCIALFTSHLLSHKPRALVFRPFIPWLITNFFDRTEIGDTVAPVNINPFSPQIVFQ